jgi:hypothetical protein
MVNAVSFALITRYLGKFNHLFNPENKTQLWQKIK